MTLFVLAGDIGGTNSRLALYPAPSPNSNVISYSPPLFLKKYVNEIHLPTDSHVWEHEILLSFLQDAYDLGHFTIDEHLGFVACLAVAGPVDTRNNRVTLTNILRPTSSSVVAHSSHIVLDGSAMETSTMGLLTHVKKCILINDFIGQGYGLLTLKDSDSNNRIVELIPGSFQRVDEGGPKACVGAGTGLGQCFLVPCNNTMDHSPLSYTCFPSEGGHVDWAPRKPYLHDLGSFLRTKYHEQFRVSVERVVSGRGMVDVYEFLTKFFPELVEDALHKNFMAAEDKGRFLGEQAKEDELHNKVSLCTLAMTIVMEAYGAEVGNAALKFLPTGGMYVTGGLTPKNIQWIQGEDSPFMKAFRDKGRLSSLVQSIPLFAVLDEDLGLYGAWFVALRVRLIAFFYHRLLLHSNDFLIFAS